MQDLLDKIAAHEVRVNHDLLACFGEIDYEKVIAAYGANDDKYLCNDDLVNCAGELSSLTHANFLAKSGDFSGAYSALFQVTHFWTLLHSSENQRKLISDKARDGANKGHVHNKAIKDQAVQYYKDNPSFFTSKDDAAEKMAVIYSRSFSTVRGWLRNK